MSKKSVSESIAAIVPNLFRRDRNGRPWMKAEIKGDRVVFSGGRYGEHSICIDVSSVARVLAHWEGYCEKNDVKAVPGVGERVNFPRDGRNWSGIIVSARTGDKTAVVKYRRINGSVANKRVPLHSITF